MMTLDVNEIRAKWSALQGVTGLVAPIQDEEGYERMVALADALIESGLASDAGELADLFTMVSTLIADFDAQHYVVPESSPSEVLRYLMEQNGLTQSELPELGSQGVVSELLSGRRTLNTRQISALVARFNISADLFIEPTVAAAG